MPKAIVLTHDTSVSLVTGHESIRKLRVSMIAKIHSELNAKLPAEHKGFLKLEIVRGETTAPFGEAISEFIFKNYGSDQFKKDQVEFLPGQSFLATKISIQEWRGRVTAEDLEPALRDIAKLLGLEMRREEAGDKVRIFVKTRWE